MKLFTLLIFLIIQKLYLNININYLQKKYGVPWGGRMGGELVKGTIFLVPLAIIFTYLFRKIF